VSCHRPGRAHAKRRAAGVEHAIGALDLAGLAFGNGGIAPLNLSKGFIEIGAEIGVLLLLFMLGLEYSGEQLKQNLRSGVAGAAIDFALNFPVGFIAGLLRRTLGR